MTKGEKRFVMYSTLYRGGRFSSMHECTGLTDEQAKGKFIIEHSNEVDHLIAEKQRRENKSRIIV